MDDFNIKQVPNPGQTGSGLTQVADFLIQISKTWAEADRRPIVLLRALASLTSQKPEQAEHGFTTLELVEEVRNQGKPNWGRQNKRTDDQEDEEILRKLIRRNWKVLEKLWQKKTLGITEHFSMKGFDTVPVIGYKQGGGSGNLSRYWIHLEKITQTDLPSALYPSNELSVGEIQYFTEDFEKAPIIGRLGRRGFPLIGWRRTLFLSILLFEFLFVLAGILVTWLMFQQANTLSAFISAASILTIVIIASVMSLKPFMKLVDHRITFAPWWLQFSNPYDDRVLELRHNDELDANVIYLARYSAQCPKCGGTIHIHSGGKEFYDRLVGKCSKNPVEHIYSFDHVLRRGHDLRV